MHVLFVHATGGPQLPPAPHVSTALPAHWVVVGEHATQVLLRHAGVAPEHVACVCQVPVAVHVWMRFPRHCV